MLLLRNCENEALEKLSSLNSLLLMLLLEMFVICQQILLFTLETISETFIRVKRKVENASHCFILNVNKHTYEES